MISTRKELREFIRLDLKARDMDKSPLFIEWLKGNIEEVRIMRYQIFLRRFEFVSNPNNKSSLFGSIRYLYMKHRFQRLRLKMGIYIMPDVVGPGLNIVHMGYIWIGTSSKIGKNCTILPRVLFGKKYPGIQTPCIFIGDNCYIGTGVTIMGPVKIGNNVTIGAGAIVTKDIPDNCIVAGNPAKIIRFK